MSDSKEHILHTALQLFLQKGFKEVTMSQIVAGAGLSKGAFYHYFTKEQVFSEVIGHFFTDMMMTWPDGLSQGSLEKFYSGILSMYEKNRSNPSLSSNYYYLIFDAIRILPAFRQQHLDQQKKELAMWKKVIATARKNGEVRTIMTDEQVAKLFIYLSDGAHVNLIIRGEIHKKKNELRSLWEGLYQSIKA
jgi:TetR/AcrR family transcriptional repressor of nem operon